MLTKAQEAIRQRNLDNLIAEIESSGDIDQPDENGRTLLMWAALEGDEKAVALLVQCGASVNIRDRKSGYSALDFAAQEQVPEIVKILLSAGADLEARDKFGNTALYRATYYSNGRGETIKELLAQGADPTSENEYGVSPLSLAEQIANYDIIRFFE
mgnify:CR=1 FL=1|tara:strand:+ start:129 stop:599 length:471 start_codon:yes stop_codon:yes gene_type:complete